MPESKKFKKTHPYSILRQLRISVILILLSVLQQVLYRPQNILAIIGSLGINALYVTVILSYYLSVYGSFKYYFDDNSLHIRQGVLIHHYYRISYDKIRTIVFYRNIVSTLFGAERISFDTPAGSKRKYDLTAYFSRRHAKEMREGLARSQTVLVTHRSHTISIILMSAFWSNPVTGMVFIVPVIYNAGKILGRQVADDMVRVSIHSQWFYYANFISPVTATLAAIILLSWAISMLLCFLRYVRLCTYRLKDAIVIVRGIISHSMTYTKVSELSSVNIDQSLLMRLMRLQSCSISIIGSGKLKGDKGMIVSAERTHSVHRKMSELTGVDPQERKTLLVTPHSVFSYIYLPLLALLLPLGLTLLSQWLPKLRLTLSFVAYVTLIVVLWWLLFRIFAYKNAHIGCNPQCLIVCSFHRLNLRKSYIPLRNIQKVEIVQSMFQQKSGKCNVKVYLNFEKRAVCSIKQLTKQEALAFLRPLNLVDSQ